MRDTFVAKVFSMALGPNFVGSGVAHPQNRETFHIPNLELGAEYEFVRTQLPSGLVHIRTVRMVRTPEECKQAEEAKEREKYYGRSEVEWEAYYTQIKNDLYPSVPKNASDDKYFVGGMISDIVIFHKIQSREQAEIRVLQYVHDEYGPIDDRIVLSTSYRQRPQHSERYDVGNRIVLTVPGVSLEEIREFCQREGIRGNPRPYVPNDDGDDGDNYLSFCHEF